MDDADDDVELKQLLQRVRPVLDALKRAVMVRGVDGTIWFLNRAAEELYGWSGNEAVGHRLSELIVPPELTDKGREIIATVNRGGSYSGDFQVLRHGGDRIHVHLNVHPLLGADGAVIASVSAAEDVTDQRRLERQVAELTNHLDLALDAGDFGTWHWDLSSGITSWDVRMERLCGLEPRSFDGTYEAWRATIHPDDRDHCVAVVGQAVERGGRYELEHRVVWPDDSVRWLNCRGRVSVDAAGAPTGTIGCAADITGRKELELARTEAVAAVVAAASRERVHRQRLEFLGGINQAVTEATDEADLLRRVTTAAVPGLGDWCSVYVSGADPWHPVVELAHVDPEMVTYARELQQRFPFDPDSPHGVAHVLRTGATEFHPEIPWSLIEERLGDELERDIIRQLALRSAIIVPLVGHDRVLGAMQFVTAGSNRNYTDDDVALAETVGARIGAALATRRLLDEQRHIARTLQASLLPGALPAIPGVDIAVRYWAAGEATEVGGDFYDVFPVPGGRWAFVIGDVCGTGPDAAAVTGLARHTIRAAARHGLPATDVLQWLNDAIRSEGTDRFCTAAYATVAPDPDGLAVDLMIGGHPRPLVATADGEATAVGEAGTLLGVFADITTPPARFTVAAGEFLVFYTDGLTDVSPPYGLTAEQLAKVVARAASGTRSADDLADRLGDEISAILPIRERDDDLALVVLHVQEPVAAAG